MGACAPSSRVTPAGPWLHPVHCARRHRHAAHPTTGRLFWFVWRARCRPASSHPRLHPAQWPRRRPLRPCPRLFWLLCRADAAFLPPHLLPPSRPPPPHPRSPSTPPRAYGAPLPSIYPGPAAANCFFRSSLSPRRVADRLAVMQRGGGGGGGCRRPAAKRQGGASAERGGGGGGE